MNKQEDKDWRAILRDLTKPNLEECFEGIRKYVKSCEEDRKFAIDTMKAWEEDTEIQALKNKIAEMTEAAKKTITFEISYEEKKEIDKWRKQHEKEKHNGSSYAGAIGGRYKYEFQPTSIGDIGIIKCLCGDEFCFRELT